jgi:hypothetical protein
MRPKLQKRSALKFVGRIIPRMRDLILVVENNTY